MAHMDTQHVMLFQKVLTFKNCYFCYPIVNFQGGFYRSYDSFQVERVSLKFRILIGEDSCFPRSVVFLEVWEYP